MVFLRLTSLQEMSILTKWDSLRYIYKYLHGARVIRQYILPEVMILEDKEPLNSKHPWNGMCSQPCFATSS
jgi:hypothetical protein